MTLRLPAPRTTLNEICALAPLAIKVLDTGGDPYWGEQFRAVRQKMEDPSPPPPRLDADEHLAAVIAARSSGLRRLDRYERRALSRRKSAIRELDAVLSEQRSGVVQQV